MNKLIIIKAGDTFDDIMLEHGGFDKWIIDRLGLDKSLVKVVDVENGEELPDPSECFGAVMTGSHSMVSERLDWSEKTALWIRKAVEADIPYFGICYGHQLLAHAMGGVADYNPKGMEIGTVQVYKIKEPDVLFDTMPDVFPAHVIHSQSVLTLPEGAVRLCENSHDANHAFRIGKHVWGVQFHPEFSTGVMFGYVNKYESKLSSKGVDASALKEAISVTTDAESLLKKFATYCISL